MAEKNTQDRIKQLEKELAETKAALADKEMLLDEILEGTLAGFWDWNIPEHTEYLSPTFKRMFGYADGEMVNSPDSWQKIIYEEDLPKVFETFNAHVESKGEVPYDNVVRYHHKSGDTVHVWCRGKVIEWGKDGSPVRMVGSHIDVSELIRARTEMERLIEQHDLIIKGINAGVWDWNIKTGQEWWSSRFYELLGYSKADLICNYETFLRLVHPDDKALVQVAVQDHLQERKPYKVEFKMQTKDGAYRWFESSGQAIWDEQGDAVHMAGSLIDIHQRKVQEKLMQRNDELLRQTGSLAKVGGWEVTLEDMQPHWSDEVYRIHEVPVGEQPAIEEALSFYPPKDKTKISKLLEKAIEKGIGFDEEFNFVTAKNNPRYVRSICSPVLNEKGETVILRGVFQDVTEKKSQEIALRESLDILSEQNKRLTNFAHIVSHNLNSHVGNIKMLTDFMQKARDKADFEQYLGMMRDASERLGDTIHHLNDIVKIQNDINRSRKEVNFEKVWDDVLKSLNGSLKNIDAQVKAVFEVKSISYVPAYLESMLLNLTTNAIKYREPARELQITVKTYKEEGSIWLSLADNGLGIDLKRHAKKLFGMYKTFHKHPESRGLGLFITRSQIEAMGGEIMVESEVGEGTLFKIRLN